MSRRRKTARTLTGTRIFIRRGQFKYFSPEPIVNPMTGAATKWHSLCKVEDGERAARAKLQDLLGVTAPKGGGDFCAWFGKWRIDIMTKRQSDAPRDPARIEIWRKGTKALNNVLDVIENAFAEFDLRQVAPSDVATFVDQWEGRRAAQVYRGQLSKFFVWCCRRGILERNPAREVSVATPKKRDVYFDDAQYVAVHNLLSAGSHNERTAALYMHLLYLFYQRGTDVRLLKRDQVQGDAIPFRPTKTERSSGARVQVPISEEARSVLEKAKNIAKLRSMYVIHDEEGQPFTARGIGDIFRRACKKTGIKGLSLKDIRSKAATDAKEMGYSDAQLQTALAHTDPSTTRVYLRGRKLPVSEVILRLPRSEY